MTERKTNKAKSPPLPPLGVHLSIAGGVTCAIERATELGINAFQCFGGNPRGWAQKPLDKDEAEAFREARKNTSLWPIVIHTSYLINLSSPDEELLKKSVVLFATEIERAMALGIDYLVTHLGSPRGSGIDFAIKRATEGVEKAVKIALKNSKVKKTGLEILFENTAGSGTTTGSDIVDIGKIIDLLDAKNKAGGVGIKTGLCFDTCHGFAAGYPFKTPEEADKLVAIIKKAVGLKRLKVIHLNDSKGEFNSRRDRHEHIGKGKIKTFGAFLNHKDIQGVPLILETPKETETDDKRNLMRVRRILSAKGGK
ncbi:MAG: deoxyribonuclease IV [Thermodesulfobacteriota bacterium]